LDKHPELIEEEKIILKKCNGLPLTIVTIGGFLANQPKVAVEWRELKEHISAEFKEFMMDNKTYKDNLMEDLQAQLAGNPNGPALKRC